MIGMACGVAMSPQTRVVIHNTGTTDRRGTVAEVEAATILSRYGEAFRVTDADGHEVTSQLTHDGLLLVEADIPAGQTVTYDIIPGSKARYDTICVGQVRHDVQDDYTWENDRGGYRLYGPAYRDGGGNVTGYDIWTKSVTYPVLSQRYADHSQRGVSYHKDHGNGMDAYTVGRTLGAGMDALTDCDTIVYPCAYERAEILDNGPLRTTVRLTCYPSRIGDNTDVVETRTISLDKGSWLNRTTVSFSGLTEPRPIVTGIVVHRHNTGGGRLDPERRYISYADLTDNPDNGNGVIYIGIVNVMTPDAQQYVPFAEARGDAVGQLINTSTYIPGREFTYYWGAGWSKGGVPGAGAWDAMLSEFHYNLSHPLTVTIQ